MINLGHIFSLRTRKPHAKSMAAYREVMGLLPKCKSVSEACARAGMPRSTFNRLRANRDKWSDGGGKSRLGLVERAAIVQVPIEIMEICREHPELNATAVRAVLAMQGRVDGLDLVAKSMRHLGLGSPTGRYAAALDHAEGVPAQDFAKWHDKCLKAWHPVIPSLANSCLTQSALCMEVFIARDPTPGTVVYMMDPATLRIVHQSIQGKEGKVFFPRLERLLRTVSGKGLQDELAPRMVFLGPHTTANLETAVIVQRQFQSQPGLPPLVSLEMSPHYDSVTTLMRRFINWDMREMRAMKLQEDGTGWAENQTDPIVFWNSHARIPRGGILVSPNTLDSCRARMMAAALENMPVKPLTPDRRLLCAQMVNIGEHLLAYRRLDAWLPAVAKHVGEVVARMKSSAAPPPNPAGVVSLVTAAAVIHDDCRSHLTDLAFQFTHGKGLGALIDALLRQAVGSVSLAVATNKPTHRIVTDALGMTSYAGIFPICPPSRQTEVVPNVPKGWGRSARQSGCAMAAVAGSQRVSGRAGDSAVPAVAAKAWSAPLILPVHAAGSW